MEQTKCLEEFKASDFYKKYQESYYGDSILKDVFGKDLRKRTLRFSNKSYESVYSKNIEVMTDFVNHYIDQATYADEETKKKMLCSIYLDPDSESVKEHGGIKCTADGLISLNRIYQRYGISMRLVEEYQTVRKIPIIHFPKESGGINASRRSAFGDRIDHTLFDLKRYCEGKTDCKLKKAYQRPETEKWLESFQKDFHEIVNWMGIRGIFVDQDDNVYDLERGDGSIIEEYCKQYCEWSESYYMHVKQKILQFEGK